MNEKLLALKDSTTAIDLLPMKSISSSLSLSFEVFSSTPHSEYFLHDNGSHPIIHYGLSRLSEVQ